MNSKNYSSSISGPLFKETLRRVWVLGAFSAAAYIIAIILPLIMNKSYVYQAENILCGASPAIFFTAAFPVFIAAFVWYFLNFQGHVATAHSLPYSRKMIYNSSNLAGLLTTVVPVIITGVLMILIRLAQGPFYEESGAELASAATPVDFFPVSGILLWMGFIIILNIAIYFATVIATMISGLPGVRIVLAFILLLTIPAVLVIVDTVSSVLLYGYVTPVWLENFMYYTSPITALFHENGGSYSVTVIIIYLIVSVVLYLAGLIAYKKRPLEKAGDTLVFGWTKPLMKCFAGFFGAALGALGLYYLIPEEEIRNFYLGAVIGGLFCFIAVDMIIQKTPKIKGFGKSLVLVAAVVVIFFGAFAFDFTGFEKEIPSAGDIKSICIDGLAYPDYSVNTNKYIDDPDFINAVRNLHTDLIGTEEMAENLLKGMPGYLLDNGVMVYDKKDVGEDRRIAASYSSTNWSYVRIDYKLKNGRHVLREYDLPANWLKDNKKAQMVAENKAFKKKIYEILNWDAGAGNYVTVEISPYPGKGSYGRYGSEIHEPERMKALIKALQDDLEALPAEKMVWTDGDNTGRIGHSMWVTVTRNIPYNDIEGEYLEEHDVRPDKSGNAQVETAYMIDESYPRTMSLIKEWGCYESAVVTPEDIDSIKVVKYDYTADDGEINTAPVEVKDKEKIREVFETSETLVYDSQIYYEIEFCDDSMEDCSSVWYYYRVNNAPSWMKELFK